MSPRTELQRPATWILLGGLVAVVAFHLYLVASGPAPRLWGDEPMYALHAREDAAAGTTGFLPGQLPFRTRPELAARVHAGLADGPGLYRAVGVLNTVLLVLVLAATWGAARLLDLGITARTAAVLLLAVFPWFGFHVHSLWPELLHATFLGGMLLALLLALRRRRVLWLVPAGVAAAFALLTKGVLGPFLPFLALVPAIALARGAHGRAAAIGRAALAAGAFLGTTLLVLAPQLVANARAGHGAHLAANRWWNLELGLSANPREGRSVGRINQTYLEASEDPMEREALARARTVAFVREVGVPRVLLAQLQKLGRLLGSRPSAYEMSLGEMQRWGADPPLRWSLWRVPGRVLWVALLAGGLAGVALTMRRDPAWCLVGGFALLFFVAAAAVPLKVRFLMPVVPLLCLLTGAVLDRLIALRAAQRT